MTAPVTPTNKRDIILEAIRAGGATRESLMKAADVNKSGLASQFSYLNTRGLAMAEVDESKAEFPIQGENGVFHMGTLAEYQAKSATKTVGVARTRSKSQVIEAAQKREDKASSAFTKADAAAKNSPDDAILAKTAEIRKGELELASMKLSKVQSGDFSYETGNIVDDADMPVEPAKEEKPTKEEKSAKKDKPSEPLL